MLGLEINNNIENEFFCTNSTIFCIENLLVITKKTMLLCCGVAALFNFLRCRKSIERDIAKNEKDVLCHVSFRKSIVSAEKFINKLLANVMNKTISFEFSPTVHRINFSIQAIDSLAEKRLN